MKHAKNLIRIALAIVAFITLASVFILEEETPINNLLAYVSFIYLAAFFLANIPTIYEKMKEKKL